MDADGNAGRQGSDGGVTLLGFVRQQYRAKLLQGGKSLERTLPQYESVCEALETYWKDRWANAQGSPGPMPLAALGNDVVGGYLAELLEGGARAATVNSYRAKILAVWNYARRPRFKALGLAGADPPDVDRTAEVLNDPTAWRVDEVGRLLDVAAMASGHVGKVLACDWWVALVLTIYDTGLRINATMHLPAGAVDLETGGLVVSGETQKQRRGQWFRLDGQTVEALRLIDPGHAERLFPWPWDRREDGTWNGDWKTLREHFKGLLRRAKLIKPGVPTRKELFHKLRKTTGTYLAANAGEEAARDHLGHSSVAVTKRYEDPRLLPASSKVEALPRPSYQRQLRLWVA